MELAQQYKKDNINYILLISIYCRISKKEKVIKTFEESKAVLSAFEYIEKYI